jgi:hypothetical protein
VSALLYSQAWTSCIYPVATMSIVGHYRRQIMKIIVYWRNTASVHPSTAWIEIIDIFYIFYTFINFFFALSFRHFQYTHHRYYIDTSLTLIWWCPFVRCIYHGYALSDPGQVIDQNDQCKGRQCRSSF